MMWLLVGCGGEEDRIAELEARLEADDARIAALEAQLGAPPPGDDGLAELRAEVQALSAELADQQARIGVLEDRVATVQLAQVGVGTRLEQVEERQDLVEAHTDDLSGELQSLRSDLGTLQDQTHGVEDLLAYVEVDPVAHDIVVSGANLRLDNGSGDTDTANGLGNLVIGYDEDDDASEPREGSHNLVIGKENGYEGVASIVHGSWSVSDEDYAAVLLGLTYEP